MKKLYYLLAYLLITLAIASCSESSNQDILENANLLKKQRAEILEPMESSPISDLGISPYIIPGENNGGNRTCNEVADAFNTEFALCGEKIDYEEGSFMNNFPEGLNVETDGMYVSFNIDGCLEIEGGTYKVGAVIVKGSDQANVYWYPEGATSDSYLASPINSSGNPAGLSNLTFCFVECESDLIIAVKTWYYKPDGSKRYALSSGELIFDTGNWCDVLGINTLPSSNPIYLTLSNQIIGNIYYTNITGGYEVTIDLNEGYTHNYSSVYIGTKENLLNYLNYYGCPLYNNAPWVQSEDQIIFVER